MQIANYIKYSSYSSHNSGPFKMKTTSVSVSEEVRDKLLRIAASLQMQRGKRVDLNDAIEYLISSGGKRPKRPDLLEKACAPPHNFKRDYKELIEERKKDEIRVKRRYGV
jgi:hypothetical protein